MVTSDTELQSFCHGTAKSRLIDPICSLHQHQSSFAFDLALVNAELANNNCIF